MRHGPFVEQDKSFAGLDQRCYCGVRVEEIEEPLMQEIRYLDKLIDEISKGKGNGEDFADIKIKGRNTDSF